MSTKANLPEELPDKSANDFLDALFNSIYSLREIQQRNRKMLQRSYQHVGKIIASHLLIENLIITELEEINGSSKNKLNISKKTFSQKLDLLPSKGSLYCHFIPGIRQVNEIRNLFAHNLDVIIEESMVTEIDKILNILDKKNPENQTIEVRIEEFTTMCITVFGTKHPEIKKLWSHFLKDNPDFTEFIKEMGASIQNIDILRKKVNSTKI
ncbi:MAG: hypothetical protein JWP12_1595 [Bacteroidetes bacterium]|nr:hypothetical protein [Bacteroidota bacterium]